VFLLSKKLGIVRAALSPLEPEARMGDVVELRSPIDLNSDEGRRFVLMPPEPVGLLTDARTSRLYECRGRWENITKG